MAKSNSCYKIYFNNLHKSWTKDKAPPIATFQEYPQDENFPVVRTLDEYIARSARRRSGEEHSELLLRFIHLHKPVVFST